MRSLLVVGLLLAACGSEPGCPPPDGRTCEEVYAVCSEDARYAPSWFSYIADQLACDDGLKQCKGPDLDGGI